uniref:Uncharacterized protein n=1 Tax=Nephroselmis pyriformis TaxID=156128 RepID=A0A8A2H8S3_9CHLO|nr:hypothetical protein LV918_pgp005 [Nephroselmis pyriformis]QSV37330.1 hypothetical protein [Nephroselmis pyriformis]
MQLTPQFYLFQLYVTELLDMRSFFSEPILTRQVQLLTRKFHLYLMLLIFEERAIRLAINNANSSTEINRLQQIFVSDLDLIDKFWRSQNLWIIDTLPMFTELFIFKCKNEPFGQDILKDPTIDRKSRTDRNDIDSVSPTRICDIYFAYLLNKKALSNTIG